MNDVEGVTVLRTAPSGFRSPLGSFSEEVWGAQVGGSTPEFLLLERMGLTFVEREVHASDQKDNGRDTWRRYTVEPGKPAVFPRYGLQYEVVSSPNSDIGIFWRGTPQLDSREDGIMGSELIVIQRSSKKVLAIRRTFTKDEVDLSVSDRVKHASLACPGRVITEGYELVSRVLNTTANKR